MRRLVLSLGLSGLLAVSGISCGDDDDDNPIVPMDGGVRDAPLRDAGGGGGTDGGGGGGTDGGGGGTDAGARDAGTMDGGGIGMDGGATDGGTDDAGL